MPQWMEETSHTTPAFAYEQWRRSSAYEQWMEENLMCCFFSMGFHAAFTLKRLMSAKNQRQSVLGYYSVIEGYKRNILHVILS
jgi:hypothetical protein